LNTAKANGWPYDIVHFDGHGTYKEPTSAQRKRGFLLFENPEIYGNQEDIHGELLGRTLAAAGTGLLVLNACRSAYSEPLSQPGEDLPDDKSRAFGSLAEEVLAAGVSGVVAMQYNVYVVTAAGFVGGVYAGIAEGRSLGEAVTLGRRRLADSPMRAGGIEPISLQDWTVPVVYETPALVSDPGDAGRGRSLLSPIRKVWKFLPSRSRPGTEDPNRELWTGTNRTPDSSRDSPGVQAEPRLDPEALAVPEAGFLGRDEVVLALDRAFDRQRIVLLYGFAGAGKTSTAAEFARWYSRTCGTDGPVLFSSFERHKPLAAALNETIGRIAGRAPGPQGQDWLSLTEAGRVARALDLLKETPLFWIWDSVEPVAGFPSGTDSAWSAPEQNELVEFLRSARQTQAKFLLTSRREEREWLGDLPERVGMPPLPMLERAQLARALAERRGHTLTEAIAWRSLLRFTEGNPLAITVLVGQALRDGLKTEREFETFVSRLRAGESAFTDERSEGRSRSLGAALQYGFDPAFEESERRQLALLQFFQGFVSAEVFRRMGAPEYDWHLPVLRDMSDTAAKALLDRAAEVGLLSGRFGSGLYSIHPALPWFFRNLLDAYYPPPAGLESGAPDPRMSAIRAFAEVMGQRGEGLYQEHHRGNSIAVLFLAAEEQNLLHARRLALAHRWWVTALFAMQGLDVLYNHRGRLAEWSELVADFSPYFVDMTTGGPREGLEAEWSVVTDYRIRLLEGSRQLDEAERLRRLRLEWVQRRAAREEQSGEPSTTDKVSLRNRASDLELSGRLQSEIDDPSAAASLQEAFTLYVQVKEPARAAACAFNLGIAYKRIPGIRDLAKAEDWFQRSLEPRNEGDRQGRSDCLYQLGSVAHLRFDHARKRQALAAELLSHLQTALTFYQRSLMATPPDSVDALASTHFQLGNAYYDLRDWDSAVEHWRQSIGYDEHQKKYYEAAKTRYNVALMLAKASRFAEARDWADAALNDYRQYGQATGHEVQRTMGLLGTIEKKLTGG